jgi:hypothetical protein
VKQTATDDLVRVGDRLQSMGNRDDRHVGLQLGAKRRLDDCVRLVVDRRGSLVEHEQFALPHDRTRERDDLPLADGQIPAARRDHAVQREPVLVRLALEREEARGAERIVQLRVVVLPEHVEVLPERPTEQLRRLRDDRDVAAERIEVEV